MPSCSRRRPGTSLPSTGTSPEMGLSGSEVRHAVERGDHDVRAGGEGPHPPVESGPGRRGDRGEGDRRPPRRGRGSSPSTWAGRPPRSSLIDHGHVKINTDYHLEKTAVWAGYPLKIPVVDIVEVGAGGGSIAWIDSGGALHVGPRSAGADPGPACYALGGTQPTVTDANLLTGRLNPELLPRRRDAPRPELEPKPRSSQIAEPFRLSPLEAALGILRLTNANMQAALERVSIERGYDPRDFTLVAYGGAGGLHGTTLARELRMKKVIVPAAPGQFSAWGMLMTNLRHDFIRTHVMPCSGERLAEIVAGFAELEAGARDQFRAEGFPLDRVTIERSLDLRYKGQEHTVRDAGRRRSPARRAGPRIGHRSVPRASRPGLFLPPRRPGGDRELPPRRLGRGGEAPPQAPPQGEPADLAQAMQGRAGGPLRGGGDPPEQGLRARSSFRSKRRSGARRSSRSRRAPPSSARTRRRSPTASPTSSSRRSAR